MNMAIFLIIVGIAFQAGGAYIYLNENQKVVRVTEYVHKLHYVDVYTGAITATYEQLNNVKREWNLKGINE